jgi:hypothetical protein
MGDMALETSSPIIDFHIHVFQEPWHPWVMEFLRKVNPKAYASKPLKTHELLRILDDVGVEYGVVLAENAPAVTGIVSNRYVAEFCSESDRLIPFASINPNTSPDMVRELEEAYELGCRGLKLLPSYMFFYPNESRMYRLYEKAEELDIPVMFHTGTSVFKNVRQKYADPIYIDDVAVDFPDLKIVLSHSGRGMWYQTATMLARIHENVYLEIAGLPPKKLLEYIPNLEELADKIIFGSDFPAADIAENIRQIRALPVSNSAKRKILGGNALRLLALST